MEGETSTLFRQWLGTIEPWQWTQSFDAGFRYGHMTTNLAEEAVYLDAKNRAAASQPNGVETRRFQTLHYPCAHIVVACAHASLNIEQFIDEVYTLKRTLRAWKNEFLVFLDLSTWEVPPTTFEFVPDKGLRRNLKGCSQSTRIHNEMDITEKTDGKLYEVCRLAGHNRSKCPQRTYHIGQSSRSGRN
ncbi:hypothetical protein GOBAR_DD01815 [Gossypium barbadense]|nr:hypothetical protein GOBAR_DD01815 [Gossypium barbadense]